MCTLKTHTLLQPWMYAHMQASKQASTHKATKKAKLTAAVRQLLLPSDNAGMPGTTQTLEPSAANPPGAGLDSQEDYPGLTDRGRGT